MNIQHCTFHVMIYVCFACQIQYVICKLCDFVMFSDAVGDYILFGKKDTQLGSSISLTLIWQKGRWDNIPR